MLHALLDREVKPDLIVGTSVGALHGALVEAAPQADVVLVAHTELEELGSFRQLHTRLPLARPIRARYWRVPATEVPHEQHALIAWVYNWWQTIDD